VSDSPAGCTSCRQNIAIGVLAVLLAITTTGWIVSVTRDRPGAPEAAAPQQPGPDFQFVGTPPEMVEVVVAAKDLPVGTMLTRADLAKLVNKKRVPKDALPPAFVVDEVELIDKRLTRAVLKDETFNPAAVTKGSILTLPEGMDMISIAFASPPAGGFVMPGSKVDVLATVRKGDKVVAFPLLVDMLVLAVNMHPTYSPNSPSPTVVSLAVTQEQALLLALAKQRGCQFELLLRHPGKPLDPDYDIRAVRQLLDNLQPPAPLPDPKREGDPNAAPAPRAKVE
jgi:Flp pilus assembly protein CpaB